MGDDFNNLKKLTLNPIIEKPLLTLTQVEKPVATITPANNNILPTDNFVRSKPRVIITNG